VVVEVVGAAVVETDALVVVVVASPLLVVTAGVVLVAAVVVEVDADDVVVASPPPQAATSIPTTVMNTMRWVGTRGVNVVMPGKRHMAVDGSRSSSILVTVGTSYTCQPSQEW
jgi:hypothetical protein